MQLSSVGGVASRFAGSAAHSTRVVPSTKRTPSAAYDRDFALNGDSAYQQAEDIAKRFGPSLKNKTVLVTGANSGIGKETARVLGAVCGATVLLACRSAQVASETAEELSSLHPSGNFVAIKFNVDLSSIKCVRESAKEILQEYFAEGAPLDVLICNAGLAGVPNRAVTEDGIEIHFGVNHIGHFLFANALLPAVLGCQSDGRVVIVSSETHRGSPSAPSVLDLDDLFVEGVSESFGGFIRYGRSKLANLLYAKHLARQLADCTNVSVYSLCPGLVNTGLGRYNDTPEKKQQADEMFANAQASGLLKTIPEGAATTVFLAAAPRDELESGAYYTNCRPLATSEYASSTEPAEALWEFSEKLLKKLC